MAKKIKHVNSYYDPFLVERLREKYALLNDELSFLEMYEKHTPEIENKNTDILWDSVLDRNVVAQDQMTRERINKTSKLVKLGNRKICILDLGIGDGWVEQRLVSKNKNIHITGIDIAGNNLKILSKKFNNFTPIKLNLENIKSNLFKTKYDYIFALEVFEHISPHKILSIHKELKKLLKPKGKLIVSVPVNEDLKEKISINQNYSEHVRRYTEEIIKYELHCSGFKITKEIHLFAFSSYYHIKTVIAKVFKIRKPSISILACSHK